MSTVKLAVVDGKTITQATDLQSGKAAGPVKIRAIKGGKFILADAKTGHAPENITIKRVGKNLHVSLEGDDLEHPALIIEDFYGNEGQLVGMGEDGAYHEYVAADAQDDHEAAFLADGADSPLVLGAQNLEGFGGDLVAASTAGLGAAGWAALGAFGLAAAGLVGAAVIGGRRDNGGGGGNEGPDPADGSHLLPTIEQVLDDVGSIQGPIAQGGFTDDTMPTLIGRGTAPGNKVEIYDNGQKIGEAIVKADGTWEFTPTTPLQDGSHQVSVVEIEAATGLVSKPSANFDFIVDTVAPAQPAIDSIYDDVGAIQGELANPAYTDDNTPTLSGRGEPNARVDIYDNGEKIGETTVNPDGTWSFTPDALPDGEHAFTVVAIDPAGNASLPSASWPVIIDTQAPGKPEIGDVWDNTGDTLVPIGNGDSTKDDTPVIGGEGEPGNTIIVIIDDKEVGTTIVGEDGHWTYEPETPLPEGEHKFEVIEKDPAGNPSEKSDPVTVIVDLTAPDAPVIDSVYDDVGGSQGFLKSGDVTDDATPTVRGKAEPNSLVTLHDGDHVVGSARADADGNWEITTDTLLTGPHNLTAKATDAVGHVSDPSNAFDFTLVTGGRPPAPQIVNVIDNEGDITGNIAPGGATDDPRPTVVGTAQAGSLVKIYDVIGGQEVLLGSTLADAQGRWEFRPDAAHALAEGEHNLKATAEVAGNVSAPTGLYPIEVDLTAPGALDDLSLIDDVGTITGPIQSGDTTDDDRPTFSGIGEPGDTIIIRDNGEVIGSTKVGGDGNWTFEPDQPLKDGEHAFTAQPVDPVGNKGPVSAPIDFTVDTRDVEISISSVNDNEGPITGPITPGGVTDDETPQVVGRATPGGLVKVYDGTTLLGSTVANEKGDWTFDVPTDKALAEGPHTLRATVTTDAKGESTAVEFGLAVDLTRPDAGAIVDVLDDVGEYQGTVQPGKPTDDNTPTLVGTAEPDALVFIRDGDKVIGSAQADGEGNWRFTPENPLADGTYDFNIVVRDPAGNESLPSASWPVIIDTQAPGKPVIDDISDNTGDTLVPIADGDSTKDDTPVIGGEGEPGNTIIVIIDDKEVGTTFVGEDGKWTYEPETPLPDGEHKFEVIEKDPAGNPSEKSDPVKVIVKLTPDATAVVDGMGKDSGVSDQDWLTNDGSAGRLVSGHLTAALAAGEKVQISTDGGETWQDAVVRADGTWVAVDPNAHSASWTIEARVTNGVGASNGLLQDVTLDVTPPPALEWMSLTGSTLSADLAKMGLAAGDKLHIVGPDFSFEYPLTQADIDAGKAAVTVPGTTTAIAYLKVGVIDQAGNVSQYLTVPNPVIRSGSDDLNQIPKGSSYAKSLTYNGMTFESEEGIGVMSRADSPGDWTNYYATGNFIHAGNGTLKTLTISFDKPLLSLNFNVDAANVPGTAMYYAADGTLLGSRNIGGYHLANIPNWLSFTAPSGTEINKVVIDYPGGDGLGSFYDNFSWTYSDHGTPTLIDPPHDQYATGQTDSLYGGSGENVFHVVDVEDLEKVTQIVGNGGTDTLQLTGADQVLDLSKLAGKLSSVEVIDITGTGDNTLKLSLGDVLEQGGKDLFVADGKSQMMVKGNAGDTVELSDLLPDGTDVGDWAQQNGTVTVEGAQYNVFVHEGLNTELLVQIGVQTNLDNH